MEAYIDCPRIMENLEGIGLVQIIVSHECLHDMHMQRVLMDSDRTGPISDEEMKEWQEADEQLEEFDRKQVIEDYEVQFFRENEPYKYEDGGVYETSVNYEFKDFNELMDSLMKK